MKVKYTTATIDFQRIMELVCAIHSSVDSRIDENKSVEFPPTKVQESIEELMILLGTESG